MSATGRDFMAVFKQRLEQVGAPVWPRCPMCNQQGWTMLEGIDSIFTGAQGILDPWGPRLQLSCDTCGFLAILNARAVLYLDLMPLVNCPRCSGSGRRYEQTGDDRRTVDCECLSRNEKA